MKVKTLLKTLVLILLISSCKKEELDVPADIIESEEEVVKISLFNQWRIVDAWFYLENMETQQYSKYDHFGPNRPISSLRWGYSQFNIEIIEQNVTVWEFTQKGVGPMIYEFVLNNTDTFACKLSQNYRVLVEHPEAKGAADMYLGGSARPFSGWTDDGINIKLSIQQAYTEINGYNHKYFTVIEFEPLN